MSSAGMQLLRAVRLAAVSAVMLAAVSGPCHAGAKDGVVRVLFFHSENCEDCQEVKATLILDLQDQYGDAFEVKFLEISGTENYARMTALEEKYGAGASPVPVVFLCERVLAGRDQVTGELPGLVLEGLDSGGCDWPDETPTAVPHNGDPVRPVHVVYFYEPGCKACDRARLMLDYLLQVYPSIDFEEYSIHGEYEKELEWAMAKLAGVPEEQRLLTPVIFVGREAFLRGEISDAAVKGAIERYLSDGTVSLMEEAKGLLGDAGGGIRERFLGMGVFAVIIAALLDSVNPCAIATLLFLISYLSLVGRKGRELIIVGAAFAGGVFVTYLVIGLGLLELVMAANAIRVVRIILYGTFGAATAVFGVLSAVDAVRSRRGKHEEMKLQLPRFLKREIHRAIRTGVRVRRFAMGAAVTGVVISVFEFACTGQVYLPTIAYMVGDPELKTRAVSLLVLYNIIFVLPLIVIFVAARYGMGSGRMEKFARSHMALVKALTAVLFLALAFLLLRLAYAGLMPDVPVGP